MIDITGKKDAIFIKEESEKARKQDLEELEY